LDTGFQNRPLGGMSSITRAIWANNTANNVPMILGQPVLSIDYHTPTEYRVETTGYIIKASKLVLSIPPNQMKQVVGEVADAITSNPVFQSVLPEPVFKAAMLFPSRWWEPELGDLGLYQTLSSCLGAVMPYLDHGSNGEGLLHVSYSDGPCAYTQWPILDAQLSVAEMEAMLLKELQFLFPNKTIPTPLQTVYNYWDGAWHFQGEEKYSLVDVQNWAANPIANNTNIFMVGEAYGIRRTWCQGGLQTVKQGLSGWNINVL